MKKIIVFSFIILQTLVFAQVGNENVSFSTGNFFTRANRPTTKEYVIDGSPYPNGKQFDKVIIDGYSKNVQNLRYNAFDDEMEFQNNGEVYFANKEDNLKIIFPEKKKIYATINYTLDGKSKLGYLVLLVEGNKAKLYKREKYELLKGEKSPSSFTKDANDYYAKEKDIYIMEYDGRFVKVPKKEKDLMQEFPGDRTFLQKYFKDNKINFSNENDIIKMVQFLDN